MLFPALVPLRTSSFRPQRPSMARAHAATACTTAVLVVVGALMSLTASSAQAADRGADMNVLKTSGHVEDVLGVQSARRWKAWEWTAGLWIDHVRGALNAEDASGTRLAAVVKAATYGDVFGSVGVTDWLSLAVHIPVLLQSSGDTLTSSAGTPTVSGAGMGDIRLGARWGIFGGQKDGFGLALAGDLSLPTATADKFAGTVGVSGTPTLVVDWAKSGWLASINGGLRLRQTVQVAGSDLGNEILLKAGLAAPIVCGKVYALGTLEGRTQTSAPFDSPHTDGLDGSAGLRAHIGDVALTAAAAGGFLNGAGSPAFRGTLALQYWPAKAAAARCVVELPPPPPPPPPPADTDGDGLLDRDDKCPTVPGVAAYQGCPVPDRDKDGIADSEDVCPDEPGVKSAHGCPDKDGDTLTDAKDRCPNEAGPVALKGCPDTDGDQIVDIDDKCPEVRGKESNGGCPEAEAKAVVTKDKIEILDVVNFDTGKSTISATSAGLLKEIAAVFRDNTDITKVRVEGHTDNAGDEDSNMKLSQDRAEAVVARLVSLGIDAKRLEPRGYGQSVPVADNGTKEGMAKNRRVAFIIVERAPN